MRLKPRKKKKEEPKSEYAKRAQEMSERAQSRKPKKRTRFNIQKERDRYKLPKAVPGERRFLKNVDAIDLTVTIVLRTEIDPNDYPAHATKKSILKEIEHGGWLTLLTDETRDSFIDVSAEGESL